MIKHKLHRLSQSDYENLRYALIEQFEESGQPKVDIYTDSKGLVTMGVGFNVAEIENLRTVLVSGMGMASKPFKTGKNLDDLVKELLIETQKPYPKNQHNINSNTLSTLKTRLEAIIANYLVTPVEFRFVDDLATKPNAQTAQAKIRATFEELAKHFEDTLSNRLANNRIFDDGTRVPANSTNINSRDLLCFFIQTLLQPGNKANYTHTLN